ncbi:MAG: hypothetical protein RL038_1045 [Actinomycetota bacterium]
MSVNLERRVAVATITKGVTKVWAVNDPAGTKPEVVMPEPADQHRNHYRSVQRNSHEHADKFDREYYEEIATLLAPASEILLIGHGKGKANEMLQLVQYLERYHKATAAKVVGAIDDHLESLTDNEILEHAKEWFNEPVHRR